MGKYINPGNSGFERIVKSKYIDKTGLIGLMNSRIESTEGLVCVSRPRRFGKSFAAQMLCAYYDCSCNSHGLFDGRNVAETDGYEEHINKYNVICFDVTSFISVARRLKKPIGEVPVMIVDAIYRELGELYPELDANSLTDALLKIAEGCHGLPGRKFVLIIDEWDALIREAKNQPEVQKDYLNLLREWFKDISFTSKAVAAAYMTGILPIKKDGSQSAVSDFIEYPILYPGEFAEYTGFTETDVRGLCEEYKRDFEEFKFWYDGYDFPDFGSIYNPYSVMRAIRDKKCRSYWQKTSASESLMTYVRMDFAGLQEDIARLLSGEEIEVNVGGFENDFDTFKNKNDVLTLLIHLGYLAYHEDEKTVRIPNEEIRSEFVNLVSNLDVGTKWIELMERSRKLLQATIAGDEDAVAEGISVVHRMDYAPTFYNDEQSLRYVVKFSYIAAIEQYMKVEELPSGHGIADVVFIPKRKSALPALVVELKWNRSAVEAISQIKDKNYERVLEDYGGEIVLVGINYDEKTKEHTCKIEWR